MILITMAASIPLDFDALGLNLPMPLSPAHPLALGTLVPEPGMVGLHCPQVGSNAPDASP